jgi:hypothetical protein
MQINEKTYEITTSQYDYGVPIVFEAGKEQGFSIGDKIVFVFNTDKIEDKEFNVNTDDYTFNLFLTKEEADNLYKQKIGSFITIRYSVKRYSEGEFLETLVDSKLIIQGTVKWNGDTGGGQNG